ncbi:unnamed protein product [Bursaphelenchus xylophilus]|uniref:(pine wood nematode) hypothetical protein n=1 Tax=Bursaphelenchus xylophilus TaxID=6326 RepID=A0A1I7RM07_BURXY|nr:unnamed protein product [Bursaphelenchus xylophilus]CAG9118081.1 unnamed protein product [Bursaphelenchus xylophilus]
MKLIAALACLAVVAYGNECGDKLAEKLIAINGDFLSAATLKDLMQQTFDQYYNQNKTLKEIADYYYKNYNNLDSLSSDQIDQITNVINNITQCVGGPDAFTKLHNQVQETALDFVKADQAQVDSLIKQQRASNAPVEDVETAVCQKTFELVTLQKKIELENKLWPLVPENCLATTKAAVSTVFKVHAA